jgi:hypothetical protein
VCLLLFCCVLQEHEQSVIELHIKREADRAAAEQERRNREAAAAWRRLLNHMWTKLELQRKYASNTDAGTAGVANVAGAGATAVAAAAAAAGVGDKDRVKDVLTGINAAAGGDTILQQPAAAAGGSVEAVGDPGAGSGATGRGQQAARSGGGRVAAGRFRRELPPGVAGKASLQDDSRIDVKAAAMAVDRQVQQRVPNGMGAGQEGVAAKQTGPAMGQQRLADKHHDLEGLEVEEF